MQALRRTLGFASQATARKPRVVVLGSGWGGNKVARYLDKTKFDVRVVSPANHFLFTPLLPSTAVGTLEFRAVQEPVRTIKGLGKYHQAKAQKLDVENRVVNCRDIFSGDTFDINYDFLVISAGCKTNTFAVPGVTQEQQSTVFFLKHLYHARRIRDRILECFERAASPVASEEERRDLLHFVVVGGGATSCEFATELSEFLEKDVRKWYPDLGDLVSCSIVEAGDHLLAGFDENCWRYYTKHLREHNVDVRTGCAITSVDPADDGRVSSATMANGTTMKFGCMVSTCVQKSKFYSAFTPSTRRLLDGVMMPIPHRSMESARPRHRREVHPTHWLFSTQVWSAGLAPIKFVEGSSLEKGRGGRIVVDEYLRAADRVFALGDCAASREDPLPPTAVAAEQQGAYLAKCFNTTYYKAGADGPMPAKPDPVRPSAMPFDFLEPLDGLWEASSEFRYVERGKMASMGMWGGVADMTKSEITPVGGTLTGVTAFASWRGAYLSKQVSVQNMILIPMFWRSSVSKNFTKCAPRHRRDTRLRDGVEGRARRVVASRRWRGGRRRREI